MIIETSKGLMDDSLLYKRVGTYEDIVERTSWVEYWLHDELVHRSADTFYKDGHTSNILAGVIG